MASCKSLLLYADLLIAYSVQRESSFPFIVYLSRELGKMYSLQMLAVPIIEKNGNKEKSNKGVSL